jgi:hypothetical protein
LAANPKTKIPQILFTVYQHVFNSIYILASILNTPYPPPDLLHPMAEKIQILSSTPKPEPEKTATQEQPATTEQPPAQTTASTQTGTQQPASGQPSPSQTPEQTPAPSAGGGAQTSTTQP